MNTGSIPRKNKKTFQKGKISMKNKMKKTLAMLLSFLMVFALLPISVFEVAAEAGDGQSEETAYPVATVDELSLALMKTGVTYIRITDAIEYTHTASTKSTGFFDVVGTKVLVGDYPVTIRMSNEAAQIKSMFYLDDPTDNLTLHNVGTYTFETNDKTDGAVVLVQDGTFTLNDATLRGEVVNGLNAGCHAVYVAGGTTNLNSGNLFGTAQGCTSFWGVLYVCGGTTNLGGTLSALTINGEAKTGYKYYNTCAGIAVYGNAHQMVSIRGNVEINQVRDHSIRTYTTSKQKISTIIASGCSVYPNVAVLAGKQPVGTDTEAIVDSVRVIKPVSNAAFRLDGYQVGVETGDDGIIDMIAEGMTVTPIGEQIDVVDIYVSTSEDVDNTVNLENTTLASGQTYWLIVQFGPANGYDASFLNSNLISLSGVTVTNQEYEYDSMIGCCYAKFELPKLKDYPVTDFVFSLDGYELCADVEDITVTAEGDTQSRVDLWGSNGIFIADSIPFDPKNTKQTEDTIFKAEKDYYLVVAFDPKSGNDITGVNETNSHLLGLAATVEHAYYENFVTAGTVIFKLPQIPRTPITSLNFTVSGYGMGKTPADITITEADGTEKVTIDNNIKIIDDEDREITAEFPKNTDLWLEFTITAADGLSVAGITDSLVSISGVKVTEKPTVSYNSTYDYMTITLKLPQINTANAVPNVWVDISGYAYGEAIADLEATIDAECTDYVELYLAGIYSQADCDLSAEITSGNFQADTDYWLEVIVVSKGSYHLEYATDTISRLNGVTYTEMNASYDKFADFFYIRVKLDRLEVPGVTVSGTITSFGDDTANVTVELIAEGETDATYDTTVVGTVATAAEFSIEFVAAGTYTMRVSKTKHATREYTIVVADTDVEQNATILLYGDVTADGAIGTADALQILMKANNKDSMFDVGTDAEKAYLEKVGNIVTSDTGLTTSDALQILMKANNKDSMFDSIS